MEVRTLDQAETYLDGFINRERAVSFDYERLGLGRVQALLAAIGSPERELPALHVAGSKGKGSTSLACEALLRAAGRRTGVFTSPHLETWRERFRIDGEPVAAAELVQGLAELVPALERLRADAELCPSFFDVCTALALHLFRRASVSATVLEVGLGGRLDSTNAAHATVSVLTSVQLEHTDKLGDTLEEIAFEKAGIMRERVPFLHGPLDPEALAVVLARSVALDAETEEVEADRIEVSDKGTAFTLPDGRRVESGVLGGHQAVNLALAVRAVECYLARPLAVRELAALRDLVLPARVERIGSVILDSAHTPDSARALRQTLETLYPDRAWVLALSLSRDKRAREIFAELAPRAVACTVARADPDRSLPTDELVALARDAGIARVEAAPDPLAAVARARALCATGELAVVTGSVYFAGAVRRALLDSAPSERGGP